MDALRPETLDTAVALADIPNQIRGFGPIKDAAMRDAAPRRAALLAALDASPGRNRGGIRETADHAGPDGPQLPHRRNRSPFCAGSLGARCRGRVKRPGESSPRSCVNWARWASWSQPCRLTGAAAEIDTETYARVLEEIAAGDGSVSTLVSVHNAPTCEILQHYGTDAQREEWLRPMAAGAAIGSFALTEPGAGSDASALRTRALRQGDDYIITGSKQFISNAAIGHTTILFAVTDASAGKKGISCFIVARNHTPGYQVARIEEKAGPESVRHLPSGVRRHARSGQPAHRRGGRGV